MEYYSKSIKAITEEVTDLEYIKCDSCGEKIKERERFWKVMTGHNSWGNDSVDSIEHNDICDKCIGDFSKDYFTGADYGTEYFEAELARYVKNDKYHRNGYDEFSLSNKLIEEDR